MVLAFVEVTGEKSRVLRRGQPRWVHARSDKCRSAGLWSAHLSTLHWLNHFHGAMQKRRDKLIKAALTSFLVFTPPLLLLLHRLVKVRTSFSWISISTADFSLKRAWFAVQGWKKPINVLGIVSNFCPCPLFSGVKPFQAFVLLLQQPRTGGLNWPNWGPPSLKILSVIGHGLCMCNRVHRGFMVFNSIYPIY